MANRPVLVALLAAGLTGCDAVYSVRREASVPVMPAADAVLAAVRGAPGVDSAAYVPDGFTGRPVPADSAITVTWGGAAGAAAFVEFVRTPGGARYEQHASYLHGPAPQREIDAAYPVMRAVEARLEAVPGLAGLGRAATQACSGEIRCPPAAPR